MEYSLLIIIEQRTGWKHTDVANILGRLKKQYQTFRKLELYCDSNV